MSLDIDGSIGFFSSMLLLHMLSSSSSMLEFSKLCSSWLALLRVYY
jgi:hypothetical protein